MLNDLVSYFGPSFAQDGALPLLENVRLHLEPGWYGLVGENGAGKTSLLRLLAGELEPDAGRVRWQPPNAYVVVCQQDSSTRPLGAEALADPSSSSAALTATLRVRRGSVVLYAGSYGQAQRQWEAAERERRSEHAHLQGQLRIAERKLRQARQRQEVAGSQLSARKRMKDRNDHDGRSIQAEAALSSPKPVTARPLA